MMAKDCLDTRLPIGFATHPPAELEGLEGALRSVFGVYYVEKMKPSPLVGRLARVRSEIDRGEDSLERKLRYLFWLN
jgi:hypothetical protein